jgi:hypothetical protein
VLRQRYASFPDSLADTSGLRRGFLLIPISQFDRTKLFNPSCALSSDGFPGGPAPEAATGGFGFDLTFGEQQRTATIGRNGSAAVGCRRPSPRRVENT